MPRDMESGTQRSPREVATSEDSALLISHQFTETLRTMSPQVVTALGLYCLMIFLLFSMIVSGAGIVTTAALAWMVCSMTVLVSGLRATRLLQASMASTRRSQALMNDRIQEQRLLTRNPHMTRERLRLLMTDREFTGEDYHALLELDEDVVVPAAMSATEAEIRRNPVFVVAETDEKQLARSCSVCLSSYRAGDEVINLSDHSLPSPVSQRVYRPLATPECHMPHMQVPIDWMILLAL
ncbi:unnamed protein product [Chrysoparadoxa australica]